MEDEATPEGVETGGLETVGVELGATGGVVEGRGANELV